MSALSQGPGTVEIDPKCTKKLADIAKHSPRYLRMFQRAFAGKSLRAAVNAFCAECVGFIAGDVRTCTVPDCPLFSCRPGRQPESTATEGLDEDPATEEGASPDGQHEEVFP